MDHVTICVCTYKRPEMLKALLQLLQQQETDGSFTLSVVVADNDKAESARGVVEAAGAASKIPLLYTVEPQQNIALVRNRAISQARGEFIAFIDDDEFPEPNWILVLLKSCREQNVTGVLGPVLPFFDPAAPQWIRKSGLYDRPRHPTGFRLGWQECRTGNVLFRSSVVAELPGPFQAEFGSGGEDQDFFRRAMAKGHTFTWCDEGPVHEHVPLHRCSRSFLIRRALLRGKNSLRHPGLHLASAAKALAAICIYGVGLPFLYLIGEHLFMRYLVKLCDHGGRLLAMLGRNPVTTRES